MAFSLSFPLVLLDWFAAERVSKQWFTDDFAYCKPELTPELTIVKKYRPKIYPPYQSRLSGLRCDPTKLESEYGQGISSKASSDAFRLQKSSSKPNHIATLLRRLLH